MPLQLFFLFLRQHRHLFICRFGCRHAHPEKTTPLEIRLRMRRKPSLSPIPYLLHFAILPLSIFPPPQLKPFNFFFISTSPRVQPGLPINLLHAPRISRFCFCSSSGCSPTTLQSSSRRAVRQVAHTKGYTIIDTLPLLGIAVSWCCCHAFLVCSSYF